MTKIVANMVIKDEADKWLVPVLERVLSQVDLLCVTDDCSSDDSADIAERMGAKVQRMPESTFETHEGRLRQTSWEFLERQITHDEPWWVLAIDADEMLYETLMPLRELIDQDYFDVLAIRFFHMWNETQFRVDKAWVPNNSSRLFRYFEDGVFAQRQLACGSEPTYVTEAIRRGKFFTNTGLSMKHLSYMTDEGKRSKFDRYTKIDGGAFHANDHILSIMDESPVLVDWPFDES